VTKRHDSASALPGLGGEPSVARQAPAQRALVHEIRERELTVDLDGRQELAVATLELGLAADVDEVELEPELGVQRADDLERPRAEAAVGSVVDGDAGYG
jgi:hypothetical protein